MPKIDSGPTDGPPGERLAVVWVTLTLDEARQLAAALCAWSGGDARGREGWHHHIADTEGNELTIAVE